MKFAGAPRPPQFAAIRVAIAAETRAMLTSLSMCPSPPSPPATAASTGRRTASSQSAVAGAVAATNSAMCPGGRHWRRSSPRPSRGALYQRQFIVIASVVAVLGCLLPLNGVLADDNGDGGVAAAEVDAAEPTEAPTTTTTEFNAAARGAKKISDKCEHTSECGFRGGICHPTLKTCQCTDELPVTNHLDKCGVVAAYNESCFFNEQCEEFNVQTECRNDRCICRFEMSPIINKDGAFECKGKSEPRDPIRYIDPAMIGILAGMALMFIIICVVLRLFSRARWHENRTIFNTPNPRLMNVSLLRESKLLHGQERRGSKMSVRMPSRQPSMASLRPHSPNPSLGKQGSRRGSRGSSNASGSSSRSNKSNASMPLTQENQHHQHHHLETGDQQQQHHPHPPQQQTKHHVRAQITNVPVIEVEVVDPRA